MRSTVCETVERASVCLFHHSTAAAACGGFAAERRAGRRYQFHRGGRQAATAPQQRAGALRTAANAGSAMLTRLNTELFVSF